MKKKQKNYSIINFLNKLLLCTIIFLVAAIITKKNPEYKKEIKEYLYQNNINFAYIRNIYDKYLGGITSLKEAKLKEVFNEKLTYKSIAPYEEGAKLEVEKNYLVPTEEKGIVVFIGNKDKYKSTVIIENEEGIDTLYGNICNIKVKMYDNIEKNTYIGETCDNYLYIKYSKGEENIDYKKYLS